MRFIVRAVHVAAFAARRRITSGTISKAALFLFSVSALAQPPQEPSGIIVGQPYHSDVSPALRDLEVPWSPAETKGSVPDPVTKLGSWVEFLGSSIPGPNLNFDGISCAGCGGRPKANGEAGATQYVQVASEAYEVFDKFTGASILGPNTISSVWNGFGGVCQTSGQGSPILLYDQLAGRWLISQLAGGTGVPTDECVAISTSSDATATWYRYGFHLGSNFFTDPKLSVWPDGYYMSVNVFNPSGTAYLGPQPFAFDRARMVAGSSPTFITPGITGGPTEASYLPADLDGSMLPPAGAPNLFVEFPATGMYRIFRFHADFVTPANSTFTLFASPPAAPFTPLCPGTANCVPQKGTSTTLDGVGARLMFRLAYRNFGTAVVPNESLVGNYSVSSGGVAGVRWFELRSADFGPIMVAQESTYQPDSTWRWLGSAAMDHAGNFALGFSASSPALHPQIRYAGRLATDPPNTLGQGEAHLFDGTGSQVGANGWGDYSALTIDPLDDCTFWYTNEYYDAMSSSSWRTRIGNFKFAECTSLASPTPTATASPTSTPSATPNPTPTAAQTPTPTPGNTIVFSETFDGVTAPALPPGWTASFIPGPADCIAAGSCTLGTNWVTSNNAPYEGPNAAFHDDPSCVTDSSLDSPSFWAPEPALGGPLQLGFSHSYNLENGFDGAVLQISISHGPFVDIITAGGSFVSNGYNGTISTGFQSPIAGRPAWTGSSGGYVGTLVNLPPAAINHFVQLRFRLATDCSGAGLGWRIDSILSHFYTPDWTPTPPATTTPTPSPTTTPGYMTVFSEGFDSVTAPALPAGWVTSFTPGPANCTEAGTCALGTNWATNTTDPYSLPNSVFHNDPGCVTDSNLDTPSIPIPSPPFGFPVVLYFWHNYTLENGFDGGVLEISIDGGAFTDIVAAGGFFLGGGGYNGTISTAFLNPLAGRPAWTGNSGHYVQTVVNMPPAAMGHSVKLRFRVATDCTGVGLGWRIDSILINYYTPDWTPTATATATPTATATATPTATATLIPTPTSTPTATPSSTPAQALNLSTRLRGQGIGGFIITGSAPKLVLLRGIGPSLTSFGVPDALADPVMELHGPPGFSTITNDNWRDTQEAEIQATGIPPSDTLESAIVATLDPGAYTAILSGNNNTSGVGLVEVYDLSQAAASKLGNISTLAFVSTGSNAVIAGFILGGNNGATSIVLRGIGPSLAGFGVPDALADPTLELRNSNGVLLIGNNDWQDDPTQAAIISGAGLAPTDALESGIAATLNPGQYTALLAGLNNGAGAGLVEVYDLGNGSASSSPTPSATPSPTPSPATPTPTLTPTPTCDGHDPPCQSPFPTPSASATIPITPTPTPTPTSTPTPTPTPTPTCPPNFPATGVVRATGVYFPANGRFYTMGGRSADSPGSDFTHPFEYNPATTSWAMKTAGYPDVKVNDMACGSLTVSGTPQIYCVGGFATGGTTATARVFSYNPVTDAITTLTSADNWPGSPGGANATILPGGFAVLGNKLYIIGGFNISTNMTAQTWQFDPTAAVGSRWVQVANYPIGRGYVPAVALGGFIYTAGGSTTDGTTLSDTTDSFKYDPTTNTWSVIANIPRATGETRAIVVNSMMYVLGGGRTAPNPSNEVDIYNPGTNTWSLGGQFMTARRNFPADSDGTSRFWLVGGYNNSGTPLNTMVIGGPSGCP